MSFPKEEKAIIVNEEGVAEVATIPFIESTDDQLVIKAKSFALNPTDWKHIKQKSVGSIVGCDAAGTVVKVGKNVKGFKVGDHVSTFLHGAYKPAPYPGAFIDYINANPLTTYKYNYELKESSETKVGTGPIETFDDAASITLSLITIGNSFYHALGLKKGNDYSNDSIIIWSGATAAGSVAIQIAKWLGFKNIIATASKNRFDFLKSLGATDLFDYKDKDVADQIRKIYGDDITYGLDTFSIPETFNNIYQTLSNTKPVYLDNLLFLGDKDITGPKKTNSVKFGNTLAYLVDGDDVTLFGIVLKASQEIVDAHSEFKKDIQPYLDAKGIKHIPIQVLEGGYDGLIEGLKILESGSYGNEKFIARL